MTLKHSLSVTLFLGTALVGCAGVGSGPVTCSSARLAMAEPGRTYDFGDYSVEGPQGEGWCLASKGPGELTFLTHALMGKQVGRREHIRNTVVMAARKIKHGAASIENTDELQQFVEEWIERGFAANLSGSEPIVGDTGQQRFTPLRSRVRPETARDADCVRYEYTMEERDNPKHPNVVLILADDGLVCRHPSATEYLVLVSLSERYQRGEQVDPGLFQELKSQEAKPFFRSLTF